MGLIDADKIKEDFSEILEGNYRDDYAKGFQAALFAVLRYKTISHSPDAPLTPEELREVDMDLVRVVRCKDCKHLYFKDFSAFCPHRVSACMPEGFCECGERRKPEEGTP